MFLTCKDLVTERSRRLRRCDVSHAGVNRSDNVRVSSDKNMKSVRAVSLRFPIPCKSRSG